MNSNKKKIAVIGGGLAGLNCANMLSDVADVTVFEKSNKVGGRMATRFDSDGTYDYAFDHGAQYFTVKHPIFKLFVNTLVDQQVVTRWDARFVEFDQTNIKLKRVWSDAFPHYVGTPAMRSIGEHLARDMDVRLNHHVSGVVREQGQWQLSFLDQSDLGEFDWVIMTLPAPQANHLITLNQYFDVHVPSIVMKPCFALMLAYPTAEILPWDAALISNSLLSWVSVNTTKPNRAGPTSVVVMSDNDWADKNFNQDEAVIIAKMMKSLAGIVDQNFNGASYIKLKKWRYANATKLDAELDLMNESMGLAYCGDWCKVGRVESAFMSSYNTALSIKNVV